MIMFLDTVSSLPEFSIIEDNKIVFSKIILENDNNKMSDYILPSYIQLEKKFKLKKNLQKLITITGPGSYTALRVGIAFMYGLSLSRKIPLMGVSCLDLLKLIITKENINSSAMYVSSGNNQNFLCFFSKEKKEFNIRKIETNDLNFSIDLPSVKTIITNNEFISNTNPFKTINYKKIEFKDIVILKLKDIFLLPRKNIIEPLYISNNKILS